MNYRCWFKGLIPVIMFVFSIFITIIMLSGCSGNIIDVLRDDRSPSPVDGYWKVVSIDGLSADILFLDRLSRDPLFLDGLSVDPLFLQVHKREKLIANKWGFFPNGNMTHEIGVSVTEEYLEIAYEPVPSGTLNKVVTLDGKFTIDGSTITIGTQKQQSRVYLNLDPFDYWHANFEEPMLKQLRKHVADELLSTIPDFSNSIFLENTSYMWDWDANTELLTFSRIIDPDAGVGLGPNEIVMEAYDPDRLD